jgi:hypothetical protein
MPNITVDYDTSLQSFAITAYRCCTDWFGTPPDEDWPCHIVQFRSNSCRRSVLFHEYYITVMSTYKMAEQSKATIAHEIYHRVTRLRGGLRKLPWLDELLAFLASQHVLRANGLSDYAKTRIKHARYRNCHVDLRAVKAVPRWKYIFGMPTWFYDAVATAGAELDRVLEWSIICRLIHSQSWDQWLQHVPIEQRTYVRDLLLV